VTYRLVKYEVGGGRKIAVFRWVNPQDPDMKEDLPLLSLVAAAIEALE
jgi:hypothetical protein